ncbi:MAG: sulfatase-like hydrolase/transferase [Planctomycetota bacterium]|jgi:arylsulfatase A-like enzyme
MQKNTNRRDFLKAIGLGAATIVVPGCKSVLQQPVESKDEKLLDKIKPEVKEVSPNIIYMMGDDHAAGAVSCYNGILSSVAKTANIDRIAAAGARLANCFVTNSVDAPSHASILTGQYSHVNGVYTSADELEPERQSVAKLLQAAGYQTAVVGKWYVGDRPGGFDYYSTLWGKEGYYNPVMMEKSITWEGGRKRFYNGYSANVITDICLEWLNKRDADKPFFLMCNYKAPHKPWLPAGWFDKLYRDAELPAPANLMDDFSNRSRAAKNAKLWFANGDMSLQKIAYQKLVRRYLLCVAAIDENVGRLLAWLDEHRLAENTIVIYTSDHGHFNGEHTYMGNGFMYEESLRVPFVIRYPKEIKAGTVNDDIIINTDFAATLLDYAGQAKLADSQGNSFRGNLSGRVPAAWRSSMYYRYWMHMAEGNVPAHYGIRTKKHKLIFYYGLGLDTEGASDKPTEPEWELFDLEKDPAEMNNLYGDPAYAKVISKLKAELLSLKKQLGDTDEKYPELMKIRKKYW